MNNKKSVAVFMWFGDKLMLSERKTTYKGMWAAAGGSVEPSDITLTNAAQREVLEETGHYGHINDFVIVDSYDHDGWRCFLFEYKAYGENGFRDIKNKEPKKHGPWKLFTVEEALALNLMPAIREYLVDKKKNKG